MSKSQTPRHAARRGRDSGTDTPRPKSDKPASRDKDAEKRRLDERLEEALEETFPASDPVALTDPNRSVSKPGKRKPPRHSKQSGPAAPPRKR